MAASVISVDTETSAGVFHPWEDGFYLSVACVYSGDTKEARHFWFEHNDQQPTPRAVQQMQELFDAADLVVMHNVKFDMNVLRSVGINFDNVTVYDTMIAEYLIHGQDGEVSYKLGDTAERYGMPPKLDEVAQAWSMGVDTREICPSVLIPYVTDDAVKAYDIFQAQQPEIEKSGLVQLVKLQSEYIKVLSDIEYNGFKWDVEQAEQLVKETQVRIDEMESRFKEIVNEPDLNLSSPAQKAVVLFGGELTVEREMWEMRTLKTKPETIYKPYMRKDIYKHPGLGFKVPDGVQMNKSGLPPCDKNVLQQLKCRTNLQREAIKLLEDHSAAAKMVSTLSGKGDGTGMNGKMDANGLIHPTMNNALTATGRLSSSNPNSQNLPRGNTSPIKKCIVPRHDLIYQVDLSQIEWRGAAFLSQDPVMIGEINDKIDQHARAVTELMEMKFTDKKDPESKKNRDHAKVFNFRIEQTVLTKPCELREYLRAA